MTTRDELFHSRLDPLRNKFHTGARSDGKHYWLTPPELYAALNAEFHFDFDPCPYPLPPGFDGLTREWGKSNYVNPPFGSIVHEGKRKGQTAWVRKALSEYSKGKRVVMVYPLDKWVLMLLGAVGSTVRNLGDVAWLAIEDGSVGPGTGRHIACFVLEPKSIMERKQMLKVTIKTANESSLNRILHDLAVDAGMSLERFDTDALLAEARRRLSKDGYVVNVVPDELAKEPPRNESEKTDVKRRGRPPRTIAAPIAAPNGAPAAVPSLPAPSRSEVIDALERYAGQNGMTRAREIIADISGIKNAALKDVNSADYRRLMEALAC